MKRLATLLLYLTLAVGCKDNPTDIIVDPFGWETVHPESQNMSASMLESALLQAQATEFTDGLLVIRNGYIVAEKYYNGFDQDTPHNIKSVSKSFLSAITGIAVQQGYINDLDKKVMDYFPEYVYPGMDPRKYDITIRHLLTMRMGIRREAENGYAVYNRLYTSENWVKNTIEEPLIAGPGEQMLYNTFQTHLLSVILSLETEKSLHEYTRDQLCQPMKIDIDDWEQDPQGYHFGGNSMYFTPREMAVLGYLYLNKGWLDGVQIIPEEWIELTLSPSTDFGHPSAWGELRNYNYAWLWWLGQIGGADMFMGYGYGGQYVVVFPDLNLIVVTTAKTRINGETAREQEWALFEIISAYIIPSICM